MCGRATQEIFLQYKLALCLYKLCNTDFNPIKFTLLNFDQIIKARQTNFISLKSNTLKVGINYLVNRLPVINNKIPLNWLNLSFNM